MNNHVNKIRENELLLETIDYFSGDPKRIQHLMKLYTLSRLIGESEELLPEEQDILCAAAIVHDVGIRPAEEKFGRNDGALQEQYGPTVARQLLKPLGYSLKEIERICYLVGHHHTYKNIKGIDYQILVEADIMVNAYEDDLSVEAIKRMEKNLFKTKMGKEILKTMFEG